ncbi:TAF6L factor, partial [Cnemophilus loriae]|nr:TAF6L factor [Cnemophilus loriae]
MAESAGVELSDDVAALLAEDVCYRLREATQNSSQFLKHTRRRRLTVEDFNRALRWSNVETSLWVPSRPPGPPKGPWGPQESPRHPEDPIPRPPQPPQRVFLGLPPAVPSAVSSLTDDLLKYYQHVTRAVLGDDPQLMKVALQDLQSNPKIAALLPYFVYVVSGV